MKLSDFDYHLPPELIAAFPPEDRPSARLLKIERESGKISHSIFRDIETFLNSGDVLVLNNTKVIPARVFGKRKTGAHVEAFFLKEIQKNVWKILLRPGGKIKRDEILSLGQNGESFDARILDDPQLNSGERLLSFINADAREVLAKVGHIPLPPYIHRPDTAGDRDHYQTVFALNEGAVAAPTAGLHFDKSMLERLEQKGIKVVYVTLHTGYGTFQPLEHDEVEKNKLFSEDYEISDEAAQTINLAKKEKQRIIACGTTSVRALESAYTPHPTLSPQGERGNEVPVRGGVVQAGRGETNIFIYPPYTFKVVTGLITNFHLPKSSLMLLVSAFLQSRDKLLAAYEEAIKQNYKFYSYGDAMLIL